MRNLIKKYAEREGLDIHPHDLPPPNDEWEIDFGQIRIDAETVHFGRACDGRILDEKFSDLPPLRPLPQLVNRMVWIHDYHQRIYRRRMTAQPRPPKTGHHALWVARPKTLRSDRVNCGI